VFFLCNGLKILQFEYIIKDSVQKYVYSDESLFIILEWMFKIREYR
jgi:hypothetical protein